jgi:hypothetical protein
MVGEGEADVVGRDPQTAFGEQSLGSGSHCCNKQVKREIGAFVYSICACEQLM